MIDKPLAVVVEDDEDLSIIFTEALLAAGFETHAIRDGYDAITRLAGIQPHVIVLDLHLPYVAGPVILSHIRSSESLKAAQVVVTTADARMAEMVEEQADFVLIKPISFSLLRDLTSRLKERL